MEKDWLCERRHHPIPVCFHRSERIDDDWEITLRRRMFRRQVDDDVATKWNSESQSTRPSSKTIINFRQSTAARGIEDKNHAINWRRKNAAKRNKEFPFCARRFAQTANRREREREKMMKSKQKTVCLNRKRQWRKCESNFRYTTHRRALTRLARLCFCASHMSKS